MILQIYTIIHTLIGLVAIFTVFVVVFGLLTPAIGVGMFPPRSQ